MDIRIKIMIITLKMCELCVLLVSEEIEKKGLDLLELQKDNYKYIYTHIHIYTYTEIYIYKQGQLQIYIYINIYRIQLQFLCLSHVDKKVKRECQTVILENSFLFKSFNRSISVKTPLLHCPVHYLLGGVSVSRSIVIV